MLPLALGAVFGCVSTVTPPAQVKEPQTVYLMFDKLHRGLVLPEEEKGYIEYDFGDWDWYALNKNQWYHVFGTVLVPNRGTLGRRVIAARDGEELRTLFHWMQIKELSVEKDRVSALREDLGAQYRKRAGEEVVNERYGISFVPHEDRFWFLYNCNDAVAGWLRRLGCRVCWVPVRLSLSVRKPE